MKKYIFVLNAVELLSQLVNGKRVDGVLFIDQNTGKLTFKAYNRVAQKSGRNRLVKKLPWGWVKESVQRIKVFGSFPKEVGTSKVIGLLNEHTKEAETAIVDNEIINRV